MTTTAKRCELPCLLTGLYTPYVGSLSESGSVQFPPSRSGRPATALLKRRLPATAGYPMLFTYRAVVRASRDRVGLLKLGNLIRRPGIAPRNLYLRHSQWPRASRRWAACKETITARRCSCCRASTLHRVHYVLEWVFWRARERRMR